jgi:RNA polymerase sigma-54 factor
MHMNVGMHLQQKQMMTLSPRMIQSMEILQLPVMALQERIEQELEENVLLENGEADADEADDSAAELNGEAEQNGEESQPVEVAERELVVDNDHNNEADFERLMEISSEWPEDNVSAGSRVSSNRMSEDGDRQHDTMANAEARPQSLHEYLLEQFAFFSCESDVRQFGEYLIQNLDHNGRLQGSLAEIVQVYGRPIEFERAQLALWLLQKCDPPGVGARDLKECLLLQLTPETPYRDVLVTLITSHLEDLAKNRLPIIQRKTGYDLDTIKQANDELHSLEPLPGRGFESRPVQNVTPDLSVTQEGDGSYVVKLEDEYVPQLRISRKYQQMFRSNPDAATKEYIKKKIESAKWLIESIEQRQNTLRRVAQAIVDHQTCFLDNGPEQIVPLKMQQIADDVGVHVTTVSRAVDDKWIQTPRGLFPLKRFFGGGTTAADGSEVAWGIIRLKLKEIVDKEDKQHPLSDDALVERLAKEGYQLARRTVTKYRKAMDIPSSRERREY